jgi:hypothetical protein
MLGILWDRLSVGGKKKVENFFGIFGKKIMPRCRAHFSE